MLSCRTEYADFHDGFGVREQRKGSRGRGFKESSDEVKGLERWKVCDKTRKEVAAGARESARPGRAGSGCAACAGRAVSPEPGREGERDAAVFHGSLISDL